MKNKAKLLSCCMILAGAFSLVSCNSNTNSSAQPSSAKTSTNQNETLLLEAGKNEFYIGETTTVSVKAGGASISDPVFESSDETVATITQAGLVIGLKAGSVTIKAKKAGYKAGTLVLTIKEREKETPTAVLEFENASHYTPNGMWGDAYNGYTHEDPIEVTEGASNGKTVGYQSQGCKETLGFTSSKAGNLRIGFVMASTAADYSAYPNVKMGEMTLKDVLKITVNDTLLDLGTNKLPGFDSMNYHNYAEFQISDVPVLSGENKIVVEVTGNQGPNMDCVNLYGEGFELKEKKVETIAPVSIGSYDYVVNGYEWGPGVNRIILHMDDEVAKADLVHDLFTVHVGATQRSVTDIYLVDANGNKDSSLTKGKDIGLDLEINFVSQSFTYGDYHGFQTNDNGCSPFTYDMMTQRNNWNANYAYKISLSDGKSLKIGDTTYQSDSKPFTISTFGKRIIEATKDWTDAKNHTSSKDATKTLSYKAFETDELKNDGVKNPLVIWLHGQGEGGTDPDIALLGNQVTKIGESKIQSYFAKGTGKGAYALAVQTPTMWMDDGNGQNNRGLAHSIYTETLKETIDTYIASNPDVDTGKIYLGGCSNGGYMTMEMALTYGESGFFKGYFPVCEAYSDSFISDEDVNKLKNLNMWFTLAATDRTVAPNDFSLPTYKRIMAAGGKNIHLSYFEKVVGNDSGHENEYDGHWSWIYLFHDEVKKDQADAENPKAPSTKDVLVDGKAVGIWEWLASL